MRLLDLFRRKETFVVLADCVDMELIISWLSRGDKEMC